MGNIGLNQLLILTGIILMGIEVLMGAITGFELLIIGVIFVIAGGIGIAFNSLTWSFIAIVVLAILYMAIGRKFIKEKLSIRTVNTNTDALIGKKGIVTQEIPKNGSGQAKVDGEIWRVESENAIEEGKEIVIHSISGVTLKVDTK